MRGADTAKPIAVSIEVIATVDVAKGPLRSTSCELHLLAARGMQLRLSKFDTGSAFRIDVLRKGDVTEEPV